ncbi:MAG TPA: molybdenum cofactor guanylyltransferase [Polyangiaceae bacterium]|nr:molybdenum cofactor guanylyltransferase [Polyangiaceae bacterium]
MDSPAAARLASCCLAGIFVGGKSSRMRGVPKGLLQPPGEARNLVERLRDVLEEAGIRDPVLVGTNPAYAGAGFRTVSDASRGEGPISGLLGLIDHAMMHQFEFALALACDMPAIDTATVHRLLSERTDAVALVPRRTQLEPLCARYHVRSVRPHLVRLIEMRRFRLMDLLAELGCGCVSLDVEPSRHFTLQDWDSPDELPDGVTCLGRPIERQP